MDRYFVPRLGFLVVLGLASLLIVGIVLRSPDTHGNLWGELRPGYARTTLATLQGEVVPETHPGIAFRIPEVLWQGAAPLDPGRRVYLGAGCATCHGIDARGGAVGPSLAASVPQIVERMVREGPGGMPAYSKDDLSDAELDTLAAYLRGLEASKPSAEELAALQRLSYDPSTPQGVLLKGKAALRQSCGACHAPPSKEEIRGGFDVGSLLATMVRETNLSLEEAKLIAQYMLAIRNGIDPVKAP